MRLLPGWPDRFVLEGPAGFVPNDFRDNGAGLADPAKPGGTAALIVVGYPEGVDPPKKDSSLTRDSARGFLIRDVIRGRNGQIMIVTAEREQR